MGQLADDVADGTACSGCGCYFSDGAGGIYTHGFPVLCSDCWAEWDKDGIPRDRRPARATKETL